MSNQPGRINFQPNNNNNFVPYDTDNWYGKELPIVASVALEEGSALTPDNPGTNNYNKAADNTSTQLTGLLQYRTAATDSDYATAGKLKFALYPKNKGAEVYFTVGSGTFTAADVGKQVELTDEKSVAVDTVGTQFEITRYISPTRGVGKFLI
jgi:hypothetical protein